MSAIADRSDAAAQPDRAAPSRWPRPALGVDQAVVAALDRWSLLAAFVAMVGIGPLIAASRCRRWTQLGPQEQAAQRDRRRRRLHLAQLAIGVLGVLVDHRRVRDRDDPLDARWPCRGGCRCCGRSSGCSRSHLRADACSPRSSPSSPAGDPRRALAVQHRSATPALCAWWSMTGAVPDGVGLLGTALGFVLRNTAAAISAIVAILFVLPSPILGQAAPRVVAVSSAAARWARW